MTSKLRCESKRGKQDPCDVEIFKFCKGIWTLTYELWKAPEGS